MSDVKDLDPVTAKETNNDITPQAKIDGLKEIIKTVKMAMLTTRSSDGHMHSRAMAPCDPHSNTQLTLTFIGNNATHKFDDIEKDSHVNVSFYDEKSTNWASFSGIATISQDREKIKAHWTRLTSAWFGDLNDGVHKGDHNDPRVSIIEVVPEEIRYWVSTQNVVTKTANIAASALTGKVSAPGELRTITKSEIQLTEGLHTT
ncbi:hypothetical protein BD410DRAFT_786348 [Rickenella mellea]|uniref:General stress protein FMN-binding split barrel domain-containing protein n=1 Tax=Rickenella mellea TaxID=50990 RepID=A0A4Y7QBK7_9AGAM|nr:hypothetical protein BD410DRAFT_786348 [Rickenella mellea]